MKICRCCHHHCHLNIAILIRRFGLLLKVKTGKLVYFWLLHFVQNGQFLWHFSLQSVVANAILWNMVQSFGVSFLLSREGIAAMHWEDHNIDQHRNQINILICSPPNIYPSSRIPNEILSYLGRIQTFSLGQHFAVVARLRIKNKCKI